MRWNVDHWIQHTAHPDHHDWNWIPPGSGDFSQLFLVSLQTPNQGQIKMYNVHISLDLKYNRCLIIKHWWGTMGNSGILGGFLFVKSVKGERYQFSVFCINSYIIMSNFFTNNFFFFSKFFFKKIICVRKFSYFETKPVAVPPWSWNWDMSIQ